MKKEELINMIRLVEEDLTEQARNKRTRDYFDGVRQTTNFIVSNLKYYDETLKDIIYEGEKLTHCRDCKYFITSPDFSCCKLTEAIVGEDDFCSKGKKNEALG